MVTTQTTVTYKSETTQIICAKTPPETPWSEELAEFNGIIEQSMTKAALHYGVGDHRRFIETEKFGQIEIRFKVEIIESECCNCGCAL